MQYSQYAGIVPATPHKSDPPLATIGGEPGGRPPIVVDDQVPAVPVDQDQTTVAFGKAEPGVDIFAGEPAKDIKSDYVAPSAATNEKEIRKEISSVFGGSSSATSINTESKKGEEPVVAADLETPERAASDEQADFSIQTHPATASEQALKQPEGPLDEVAAEADRAAQELYPEAHDKK